MNKHFSRCQFIAAASTSSAAWLLRKWPPPQTDSATRVLVREDDEIGLIRPELHGQFAEHLGSCVYGGLWLGKDSHIPAAPCGRSTTRTYIAISQPTYATSGIPNCFSSPVDQIPTTFNGRAVCWTAFGAKIPNGIAMHYYSSGSDAPTNFTPQHMNDQF